MRGLDLGVRLARLPSMFEPSAEGHPVYAVRDVWINASGLPWRRASSADTLVLARHAAAEACRQAGLPTDSGFRLGVCLGTTAGSALHFLNGYEALRRGGFADSDKCADISDYFQSSLAAGLAKTYQAAGPLLTLTNACTSGTDAVGVACELLRLGVCDCVIAGGADALSVVPYVGFNRLMIYSPEPCKPFDKNRRGLNLGEGAGVLVLESADFARKRGATPLAAVLGYGSASDAHHFTAPHPDGRGLRRAISTALRQAGIGADELAFVNAHGTSTKENDRLESAILSELCAGVPVWASKGGTGHCLGAAGALEAAFSISALIRGKVPASVGCAVPEDSLAEKITLAPTEVSKKYALSVSLGFGGGNAAVIFGKVQASYA